MAIVARGLDLDAEITVRQLVNFLQRHAEDLRAWDGKSYEVVDPPGVSLIDGIKAVSA